MDRRSSIILFVVLVLALLRYVVATCYVHPFADDFSYAVAGMHNELFKRLVDEYHFWNGRWASNVLVLRGPLVLGLQDGLLLYRVVPVVLLVFLGVGAYALLHRFALDLGRGSTLGVVLAWIVLFLHLLPDLSEGVYWYTGAVTYLLPGALMLVLFAVWMHLMRGRPQNKLYRLALAVVLIFLIAGCNELHMVYMVLFHALCLFVFSRPGKRVQRVWVVGLVAACTAAAIMIAAPGNAGRAAQFPLRGDVLHTLYWSTLQTGRFLITWVTSPALLLFSVLALQFLHTYLARLGSAVQALYVRPLWIAVLIVGVVFLSMALPYWSTGLLGQHRTVNATLVPFLLLWCWLLFSIAIKRLIAGRPAPLSPHLQLACVLLLAVVLAVTGGGGRLTRDLATGAFPRFDAQLQERYHVLEQAATTHQATVRVSAVVRPTSLRYLDGGADGEQWINRSIMQYFGADGTRLVVVPLTEPMPR